MHIFSINHLQLLSIKPLHGGKKSRIMIHIILIEGANGMDPAKYSLQISPVTFKLNDNSKQGTIIKILHYI